VCQTGRFNITSTKDHHWTWSRASSIHLTINVHKSVLMLSSHLFLGLPRECLPTKFQYSFLVSPILVICPTQLTNQDFIILTVLGNLYKSWSSSLFNVLHLLLTSFFLGPIFSWALCLATSVFYVFVTDHVSNPCKRNWQNYCFVYSDIQCFGK
jgi:hypothetical protein